MVSVPREAYTRNGAYLVVPPLAISFGLWGLLPEGYAPETFDAAAPAWLRLGENILRTLVLALPLGLRISTDCRGGWITYAVGLVAYLGSYLWLAAWPDGRWTTSAVGFTAPAWTPALWMLGIAMICRTSWVTTRWKWWTYLVVVAAFLGFHVGHTGMVWSGS